MKQGISTIPINITIGFLYWLSETHDLRGLKNSSIEEYPLKIEFLLKEYKEKYPSGLTGWSTNL